MVIGGAENLVMNFSIDAGSLDSLMGAALVLDSDGNVRQWNRAAAHLLGRLPEETVGRPWWHVVHEQLRKEPMQHFQGLASGATQCSEYLVDHPDGRVFWVQAFYVPLRSQNGAALEWMLFLQEQKVCPRTAIPLTESELQLDAVLNAIPEAVLSLDEDGRVIFFNVAAERIFGIARAEVVGRPIDSFPALSSTVVPLLRDGQAGCAAANCHHPPRQGQRANGELFPLEGTVSSLMLNGKQFQTLLLRDVTVQQQRQQAMTQSQKMLAIGALASGVAHDFNNILTAILSHLDLAASDPCLAAGVRENLAYAQTSARRGAELVSKLLTFSRQTEARSQPLNLYDLSAEVVSMLRRSIDRRILIRHVLGSQPLWLVQGDSSQLMQVLMNLCINARDAMPHGGELSLKLENVTTADPDSEGGAVQSDFVRLTVSDTGEGMSQDVLARLFEPYFTTKAVGKGTGLGLSIAYSVVSEHGGWMEVESQPGVGSQFHAHFPRAKVNQDVPGKRDSDSGPLSDEAMQGHERILVVDDDEMVRLVTRAVLSYRGYQVVEAGDGIDAVSKYEAGPRCDLVLLDLNMPRMDGWDAMRNILQKDPEAVIVLLSGGMTGGDFERARVMGARGVLTKPFENHELARLVRRTLDEAKARVPGQPPSQEASAAT